MDFDLIKELGIVATAMEALCDSKEEMESIAREFLSVTRNCFFIGRSLDYYVGLEGALKLKEISYIQAEGFAGGELKHGTIALIEEGTPVVALATQAGREPKHPRKCQRSRCSWCTSLHYFHERIRRGRRPFRHPRSARTINTPCLSHSVSTYCLLRSVTPRM